LVMLVTVLVRGSRRAAHGGNSGWLAIANVTMYWHFVDVVWICVFASLYVLPHVR